MEGNQGIHISGVGGDIIGVNISGSDNVIGKNVNVSKPITINNQQLDQIPDEFAKALKDFSSSINVQMRLHNVPPPKVIAIQSSIDDLIEETKKTIMERDLSDTKKSKVKSKFLNLTKIVLKTLPTAAETISTFTPLAPFSKLIGEGTQSLIESIQKEL